MKRVKNESGIVLLVCLLLLFALSLIGLSSIDTSNTDMHISFNEFNKTSAFYLADAGSQRACAVLRDSVSWRGGFSETELDNGTYNVVIVDSLTEPKLGRNVKILSTGIRENSKSAIEVIMGPALVHPLYNYAIYAGNYTEYDPDADPMVWTRLMNFGGCVSSGDLVVGDIFFNGNVDIDCAARIDGDIDASGDIWGNPPSGEANDHIAYLDPPDLQAMNYETSANYIIDNASPWTVSGRISSSDPRHIFVKDYRSDLAAEVGFEFDNTNYFLGDPYEMSDLSRISVSSTGNRKVYFVDGNLWIEPGGTISRLVNSPPGGTQITIVAKGNIYFCDDFAYNNSAVDGIAFIAMSDGESYTDLNGNNQFEIGEPILHDDGDGIYEGNREGSGNVCFGDPNGGPLGNVSGFIYADNNFQDYVLDGPDGNPQEFGVNGLLSAGNLLNINRDFGSRHARMTINYDNRLHNEIIDLPGLPRGSLIAGWVILSWREL